MTGTLQPILSHIVSILAAGVYFHHPAKAEKSIVISPDRSVIDARKVPCSAIPGTRQSYTHLEDQESNVKLLH